MNMSRAGCCVALRSALLICALIMSALPGTGADLPSPTLLVLNKGTVQGDLPGDLAFVDPKTGQVFTRIPVGNEPHEVAISANGELAVVTNTGSYVNRGNTLSVIDISQRKEIHRVSLGALWNPHGVIFKDGKFYFTAEGSKMIGRYDPSSNQVDWQLGVGQNQTHLLTFSKDGKLIFTMNRGSKSVSIIEPLQEYKTPGAVMGWTESMVPVCGGPDGIDVSPDGRQIWVGCRYDNKINIIDIATRRVTESFDTNTKGMSRVKFTPDGLHVVGTDVFAGQVLIFDVATRKEIKRIDVGKSCEGILISPDGLEAFIGVTDSVAVIDLRSFTLSRRLSTGLGPDGMAWLYPKNQAN